MLSTIGITIVLSLLAICISVFVLIRDDARDQPLDERTYGDRPHLPSEIRSFHAVGDTRDHQ